MARRHVIAAEKTLHDQTNLLPKQQLAVTFGILCAALLVVFIDQNGISVTLPTIAKDLNAEATISWAGTASLLANTTFQMLYGRLSDIFGRKVIFLAAILLLSLADLLCGLSQNATMLYTCRALAGIGGGGITNLVMIIVSDVVTLEQRGQFQGLIGGIVGLGNVLGPFIAAGVVYRSTWRAFFWALAPFGVILAVLAYIYLPSKPPTAPFRESIAKVDWAGSLLSSIGIVLLLVPISGGGSYFEWDSPMVISMLVIGAMAIGSFVIWEWKYAALPMMPVTIYKNYMIVVMLLQNFFFGAVYQSYLYYIPLYLQNPHQYSIIASAGLYMPLVVAQSISSILSGQYISIRKRYGEVLVFGFGIWTLGAGIALKLGRSTGPGLIIVSLGLIGLGVGCIFQPTLVALQAHTPKRRRAVIISNRNLFRCAGGACGLTASAQVLQARLRDQLPLQYQHVASSTYALPASIRHVPSVLDAYMAASHSVFLLQVPLIGLCLLGVVLVRDRGLEPPEDTAEQEREQVTLANIDTEARKATN